MVSVIGAALLLGRVKFCRLEWCVCVCVDVLNNGEQLTVRTVSWVSGPQSARELLCNISARTVGTAERQ